MALPQVGAALLAFLVMQWLAALHPYFHTGISAPARHHAQLQEAGEGPAWSLLSASHSEGSEQCKSVHQLLHATPFCFAHGLALPEHVGFEVAEPARRFFVWRPTPYFQARAPPLGLC